MSSNMCSPNFEFLKAEDDLLYDYAMRAERYVFEDPNTCLFKLRQFSEYLTQQVAVAFGVDATDRKLNDLINDLYHSGAYSGDISRIVHSLRREGNTAAHSHTFSEKHTALQQLKLAHKLSCWYQQTINDSFFKFKAFVPPPNPHDAEEQLMSELEELRQNYIETEEKLKLAEQSSERQAELRSKAEEEAEKAYKEAELALGLAEETEAKVADMQAQYTINISRLKEEASSRNDTERETLLKNARAASAEVEKDEATTRILIDQQLRDHGWEVDTRSLRYGRGTRPAKNRNMAISEWPTESGPADYVLFCGLKAVAVIEAKREMKNVAGDIVQAKRYSRTFRESEEGVELLGPWNDMKVPFLFATNGQPYQEQYRQMSGTWFLDCRESSNHPRPFDGWYTPEGIQQLLRQNIKEADKQLAYEENNLPLRYYQRDAVEAVETAISEGQREIMLAMATGTGKTRTCIGLVYRLIKSRRFRRVLFLVDRTSLGEQAMNAFKDLKLENQQTFNDIFDIKGLGDKEPETATKLHISTVQGIMHRLLYPSPGDLPLPVDMYDCIVVDECHRGYNLDREMSELELSFRSELDYISKYRRVIEHFDAVKIGLTATPALHTIDIFGMPVYDYPCAKAVIDGYLVDQEVPIIIETKLSAGGIKFHQGDEVTSYNKRTKDIEKYKAPDEVTFDVDKFNTKVISENFNRALCTELVKLIDINKAGKTLIFCAADDHADLVVKLLKEAYAAKDGKVHDDAIVKITGRADKPNQLIRTYKNESNPKIAVTVDLMTTGIDVPEICNLVFIRCVKSRILYDQMIGRATRLCPDIGKESYKIYDCVGIYKVMSKESDMVPVVTRPKVPFTQLAEEMEQVRDEEQLEFVRDQYLAKFNRNRRKLEERYAADFELTTGMEVEDFHRSLRDAEGAEISDMAPVCREVANLLARLMLGGEPVVILSDHGDEVIDVRRGYGEGVKPEDYLESFKSYLESHRNEIAALTVIEKRPRDLTLKTLKEVRTLLAQEGFSVKYLKEAWKDANNQDIAASIIGFIRAQTIGSALLSYEERLEKAMQKIYSSRRWTIEQEQWLKRIKKVLKEEKVVDRDVLNIGSFKTQGGFNRINKVFDGELDKLLHDINEAIWEVAE